jgi:hypothetical protein
LHLTDIEVQGVTIAVTVDEKGKFIAAFNDTVFENDRLDSLRFQLRDAVKAARVEVPFVIESGRRGIIRGYHGGKRAVLVTWASGAKGDLPTYYPVFKPETLSDEEIEELRQMQEQEEQIKARRAEINQKHLDADDLLSEVLGEDLTDHRREKEWLEQQREV